jgi:hypothetical protein
MGYSHPELDKLLFAPDLLVPGKKPIGRFRLKKNHDLTRNLVHSFLFDGVGSQIIDLVTNKAYTYDQYGTIVTDIISASYGRGIRTASSTTSKIPLVGGDGSDYDPGTRSFSCYHLGLADDTGGNFDMMFNVEAGTGGDGFVRFSINNVDVLRLRIDGDVGASNLDGVTTVTPGVVHGMGFSADNTGSGIYRAIFLNGVLENSGTDTNNSVNANNAPAILGGTNAYIGESFVQHFWMGRALSAEEQYSIHQDPLQFVETEEVYFASSAAVAGGGIIHSLAGQGGLAGHGGLAGQGGGMAG